MNWDAVPLLLYSRRNDLTNKGHPQLKDLINEFFRFKLGHSSLNYLPAVSSEKQMTFKRLMIIIGIVLLLLLMIFANTTESTSECIPGASEGTLKDLEKDLPKEEKIPTH